MSVGAAKVALHRARARLAQLLQVEVHDEPR
jgi:DNA-directed RNA polymerase specialized sigma24 family protein